MSPQFSEEDIEEEQVHFSNVVATFQQYAQYSVMHLYSLPVMDTQLTAGVHRSQLTANNRRRKDLYTLPQADKALLDSVGYRRKLQEIDTAILANADFLHKIVANPEIFGHDVTMGEDGGMEDEDVTLEDSAGPFKRSAGLGGQGRLDSGVDCIFRVSSMFFF